MRNESNALFLRDAVVLKAGKWVMLYLLPVDKRNERLDGMQKREADTERETVKVVRESKWACTATHKSRWKWRL